MQLTPNSLNPSSLSADALLFSGVLQLLVAVCALAYPLPWFTACFLASGLRTLTHSVPFASSYLLDIPIMTLQAAAAFEAFLLYTRFVGHSERSQLLQGIVAAAICCSAIATQAPIQALPNPPLAILWRSVDVGVAVALLFTVLCRLLQSWDVGYFPARHMRLMLLFFGLLAIAKLWPIDANYQDIRLGFSIGLILLCFGWFRLLLGAV